METVTVRIWKETRQTLKMISAIEERSMVAIMQDMVYLWVLNKDPAVIVKMFDHTVGKGDKWKMGMAKGSREKGFVR